MPTSFFVPHEQLKHKESRKGKRMTTPRVARVSYVEKAKLVDAITKSIAAGNTETFRHHLESAMIILSREARVADDRLSKLLRSFSAVQLDPSKDDTKMLSTGAVAKKLGVSNQAVINWIETGKIKAIQTPGGHYRIPADQFRTTDEQDATSEAIFEKLWAKRAGMPQIDEDDLRDL